jgi:thioredoxin 1
MSEVIHFSEEGFQKALKQPGVLVVDFWATWCGPCRMIAPAIEQLAKEFDGQAVVGKVDVDDLPELAASYGVMSIPNVVIFKDGEVVDRKVGAMPPSAYSEAVKQALT